MTSETRYFCNTEIAAWFMLLTSNTIVGTSQSCSASGSKAYCDFGIRIYVEAADSSETEIDNIGGPHAIVRQTLGNSGMLSNTWDCPETALNDTDRIAVKVYGMLEGEGWALIARFHTNQVQDWDSPIQLVTVTWTVYYQVSVAYDSKTGITTGTFFFGSEGTKSRIENFTWSDGEPPPSGVLRRLLVGVGL